MTLKLGAQNMFLLNDPNVVRDLIEKRQANYSVRPDLWVRSFGDNLNIALREYALNYSTPSKYATSGLMALTLSSNDDVWRRQRKIYHVRLNVKSADRYLPYQVPLTSLLLTR